MGRACTNLLLDKAGHSTAQVDHLFILIGYAECREGVKPMDMIFLLVSLTFTIFLATTHFAKCCVMPSNFYEYYTLFCSIWCAICRIKEA